MPAGVQPGSGRLSGKPTVLRLVTPEQHARFQIEGEALARLQHPNVVQIFDVGVYEHQLYFALELVESGSLATRLDGQPIRNLLIEDDSSDLNRGADDPLNRLWIWRRLRNLP